MTIEKIQLFLREARLPAQQAFIKFWVPSDYILLISESEAFYKNLSKSQKFIEIDFSNMDAQSVSLRVNSSIKYADSRSYTRLIHELFKYDFGAYTVLDIGGYLGRFSIEFCLMLQENNDHGFPISMYCFEPSPMRHLLDLNLSLNTCSNVLVVDSAVTDKDGSVDYLYKNDVLISGRIRDFPRADSSIKVKSTRVDSFLKLNNIENQPILAKIDVEGAEDLVLKSFGDKIHNLLCAIVEYWPTTFERKLFDGANVRDFVFSNFHVLYIRNSLYPCYPMQLVTGSQELNEFLKTRDNVDVLMLKKGNKLMEKLLHRLLTIKFVEV